MEEMDIVDKRSQLCNCKEMQITTLKLTLIATMNKTDVLSMRSEGLSEQRLWRTTRATWRGNIQGLSVCPESSSYRHACRADGGTVSLTQHLLKQQKLEPTHGGLVK